MASSERNVNRGEVVLERFHAGKEYLRPWGEGALRARAALGKIGVYLLEHAPIEESYPGSDNRDVQRRTLWVASERVGDPRFMESEAQIEQLDGDKESGLRGLTALGDVAVRNALQEVKSTIDADLIWTARQVGIPEEVLARSSVRYRVARYDAEPGREGGIGLHPDGNALSALMTDAPGLKVYDLGVEPGTPPREPYEEGTVLMVGSTLYRVSNGMYVPAFHDVSIEGGTDGHAKTSVVGFLNFPDGELARPAQWGEGAFHHDVREMKLADSDPDGDLAPLWDRLKQAYPDLELQAFTPKQPS